jgi:FkbM family methyltransferase
VKSFLKSAIYKIIGPVIYPVVRIFGCPPEKVFRKMKFIGKFRVRTKSGKRFFLYNNAFRLETYIFWKGYDHFEWELETRKLWSALAANSNTILDIGANTGIFSVVAKSANPEALVIAFEPQPNIYEVLERNSAINKFDIRCEKIALSDSTGEALFFNHGPDTFSGSNTTSGSLNKNWRPKDQQSIRVKTETLDDFIARNKIPAIDLIKIDVESHELEVIAGYAKNLPIHKPIVIIEILDLDTGKKISAFFPRDAYRYFMIDEKRGLEECEALEGNSDNNYLLVPKSKLKLVNKIPVIFGTNYPG